MVCNLLSFLTRLSCLVVWASFPFYSWAQANSLSDYFVDVWTSSDGLPHNSINAIAQTDDGYLWFATWEGVARYNGLEFKLFDRSPETHMQDSGTRALVASDNNSLWVGGARGSLSMRTGFTWQAKPSGPGMINHILKDHQGNLWLAIEGKGVVFRPAQQRDNSEVIWALDNVSAYRIIENKQHQIFAATDKGLFKLKHDGAEKIASNEFDKVNYISLASNGDLLLATNHGAWRWNGKVLSIVDSSLKNVVVTVIEQDSHGSLWIGTINKGLARIAHQDIEFLDASRGLPHNRVLSWYQDIEGSIWVGTNGGVMRLRSAPFASVTNGKGLVGNYVRSILPISGDTLMVGSSNGLSLLSNGRATQALDHPVPLSVLSLAKSSEGGVWVGSYQHGVMHWKNRQITQLLTDDDGLPTNEVRALLEDSKGNLWIGTPLGVVKKSPDGKLKHYTQADGLSDNYVMALSEDEFGHIWVGTGVGVGYLADEQFINLKLHQLEQAQYAFGFYIESGYVWIATDRGIIRYRQADKSTALIGRPHGLPIDKFFQIQKDNEGYFWLSSNRGIWKIEAQQAHLIADGNESTIRFEHYDESDGMASSQANGGSNPASAKLADGSLFFATAKGVASIHPDSLHQLSNHPLPVVLQSVLFDSMRVNPERDRVVPAGTNRVSISYVGLGYVMSDRIQYRTKLIGFDTEWSERRNFRTTEYTNLPPRHYRLLVSARYPYGDWTEEKLLYEFEVEPLFWQRREVITFFVLAIIVLVSSVVFLRIKVLKNSELRLKEQVELQTQELRDQAKNFERLSNEDELTGLANRRAFDSSLRTLFKATKSEGKVLNVAVLDIDHFKLINDTYSHLVGDKAIIEVVNLIKRHLDSNTLLARWGGEEFTLLYVGDVNEADSYLERLRQDIADHHFDVVAPQLRITVSIGVCDSDNISDYKDILKQADHALLDAKRNGRNRVERRTS